MEGGRGEGGKAQRGFFTPTHFLRRKQSELVAPAILVFMLSFEKKCMSCSTMGREDEG